MALAQSPCSAFRAATDRTPLRRLWSFTVGKAVSVPVPLRGGARHDRGIRADDHPIVPTRREHRHDPSEAAQTLAEHSKRDSPTMTQSNNQTAIESGLSRLAGSPPYRSISISPQLEYEIQSMPPRQQKAVWHELAAKLRRANTSRETARPVDIFSTFFSGC